MAISAAGVDGIMLGWRGDTALATTVPCNNFDDATIFIMSALKTMFDVMVAIVSDRKLIHTRSGMYFGEAITLIHPSSNVMIVPIGFRGKGFISYRELSKVFALSSLVNTQ